MDQSKCEEAFNKFKKRFQNSKKISIIVFINNMFHPRIFKNYERTTNTFKELRIILLRGF